MRKDIKFFSKILLKRAKYLANLIWKSVHDMLVNALIDIHGDYLDLL